jgi:integrase
MILNDKSIAKLVLPPDRKEWLVFDDKLPGFGIRLREGGSKTWIAQYRLGSRQRRLKLGSLAQLNHEKARTAAKAALAKAQLGIDPQIEKSDTKKAAEITLLRVVEKFLAFRERTMRPAAFKEVKRHLEKHWLPLHSHAIRDLTRASLASRLREIGLRHGLVAADRARASLSAMMNWAIREGLAEVNNVTYTNRQAGQVERDRVLTDDELRVIWLACVEDDYGTLVRLLMLIPVRRGELGSIRWSEINEKEAVWRVPAQRSKNHQAFDVPLTPLTLAILKSRPRIEGRDVIFGRGGQGFKGWSKSKRELDAKILKRLKRDKPDAKTFEWRLHDLRRTTSTRMHELGAKPHIVETLLNHVGGHKAGVAGVYNRATYDSEREAMLSTWQSALATLLSKA